MTTDAQGHAPTDAKAPRPEAAPADEVAACLADLGSTNPHARSAAARRLGELRAAPEALLEALGDPNPYVRAEAARALGAAASAAGPGDGRTAEAVEGLLCAIDDRNDHVCAAALHALGVLRAAGARDQVLDRLGDHNPSVVAEALYALGRIGGPGLGERVASFLDERHPRILNAAAGAVAALGHAPAAPRLLRNLERFVREGRRDVRLVANHIGALAAIGAREAVPLLRDLARRHVGLRSAAVAALAELDGSASAPLLVDLLRDPSERLRKQLLRLIARADCREALPWLRPLLRDRQAEVRRAALALVARWGDPASVDDVARMCHAESDPHTRPEAVAALVALLGPGSLPTLLALVADPNPVVRRAVADGLGRLDPPPPEAAEALARLALDVDCRVAEHARQGLEAHHLAPPAAAASAAAHASLVPAELRPRLVPLLPALLAWQAALAGLSGAGDPRTTAELDRALTTLVVALRSCSAS
jgi:HEAT repeat protein